MITKEKALKNVAKYNNLVDMDKMGELSKDINTSSLEGRKTLSIDKELTEAEVKYIEEHGFKVVPQYNGTTKIIWM